LQVWVFLRNHSQPLHISKRDSANSSGDLADPLNKSQTLASGLSWLFDIFKHPHSQQNDYNYRRNKNQKKFHIHIIAYTENITFIGHSECFTHMLSIGGLLTLFSAFLVSRRNNDIIHLWLPHMHLLL
jgi:hypothetical protein